MSMPVSPTYPGVYIEEMPSAVRTIMGVPTAVTAFVGRTLRGPVDKAITIHSWGEFVRLFGGLWELSNLGYAVRDFYVNAPGGEAVIVRLFNGGMNGNVPIDGRAKLDVKGLKLAARSPGQWGNHLRVRIDDD